MKLFTASGAVKGNAGPEQTPFHPQHCSVRTTSHFRGGVCQGPVLTMVKVLFLSYCSIAFTWCVVLAVLELCLTEVGLLSESCSSFDFVLHHSCCALLADSGQWALSKSLELKFSYCVFVLKVYARSKNCLFYYSQWYSPAQVPERLLGLYLANYFYLENYTYSSSVILSYQVWCFLFL